MTDPTEPPELLERQATLRALQQRLEGLSRPGSGCCVVLHGEPGIGKSSVLAHVRDRLGTLAQAHGGGRPAWWGGGCEPLAAPAPLGPLLDCLDRLPAALAARVREGRLSPDLLADLMQRLRDPRRPVVWAIDDAQWADDTTLDLLRYVGRRIDTTQSMLLLACRDDALAPGHPLLRVLGLWPAGRTLRLPLRPLSSAAVQAWAQRCGRDASGVHQLTGGNPFFVAQWLAAGGQQLPATVRDAVLGQVAALPADTQGLLQQLCVLSGGASQALLAALRVPAPALAPALMAGLLNDDGVTLAFRHELARQALEGSLPAPQRRLLHAAAHSALCALGAPAAARVQHAVQAGLVEAAGAEAEQAAADASRAGQHRQAAAMIGLRLNLPGGDSAWRARWLEARAQAWMLANELPQAMADRQAALDLCVLTGDVRGEGRNGLWLARLHWQHAGQVSLARPWADRAVQVLQAGGASRELAEAFSTQAHLCLVADDMAGTLAWGERALAQAEADGEALPLVHALNNVGTARARLGDLAGGLGALERSAALAARHGAQADVARAHLNQCLVLLAERQVAAGLARADAGVAHAEAHGLDVMTVRLRVRRAHARLLAGLWADARADLDELARHHSPAPMEACARDYVAALLALRLGVPGARGRLRLAVAAMQQHQVELWFVPTAAALAEAAWLARDARGVDLATQAAWASLAGPADRWRQGELAVWRHRAGLPALGEGSPWPAPQALEVSGRPDEAARAWDALGCPYDAALALAGASAPQQREALQRLRGLGAEAAARHLARRLQDAGQGRGSRGAYRATRQDPLGLTPRERQVLELLAQDLSNRQIGQRLGRSERTVEKHVASLLDKLGAGSRREAAQRLQAFEDG